MKQYKVEITKEALQDMEDIYIYIAIDLLLRIMQWGNIIALLMKYLH